MSAMRVGAPGLIAAGILMLGYPALSSYTTRDKVVEIGPLKLTKEKEHSLPVVPIAGGIAIVIGIGWLLRGRRRS